MMYVITGGAGFIGTHLADLLLSNGHQVRIVDDLSFGARENIAETCEFVQGDVTDIEIVDKVLAGAEGCFHLAAISSVGLYRNNLLRAHQVNLGGTINVFKSAAKHRIPVVYASSAAVYGDCKTPFCSEVYPVTPISFYGIDKYACELYAHVAAKELGLKTTGIRIFNCYGNGQRADSEYSGVIAKFASRISCGEPITIYGDGSHTRDFISVKDVIRLLVKAMQKMRAESGGQSAVVNACTGTTTDIFSLARTLAKILQREIVVQHADAREGDIAASQGDPQLCKKEYGWKAEIPLETGLRELFGNI